MTDNSCKNDNTIIPSSVSSVPNDLQTAVENDKGHSDQNEIPSTINDINNDTQIHIDQSSGSNGATSTDTNERSTQHNTNDQSSNLCGTTSADKNEMDVQLNPNERSPSLVGATSDNTNEKGTQINTNDQSSESSGVRSDDKNAQLNTNDPVVVRNESRTENEKKTNVADTSVQSLPHLCEPMDQDDNHTKNTNTNLVSVKTETLVSDNNEQHIDNSSNVQSLLQANEQTSGSASPKQQQQEENTLILKDAESIDDDDIHLSFNGNNAGQDGDIRNNQLSAQNVVERMETDQNNEQTDKTPFTVTSEFTDLERGHSGDQSSVPLDPWPNNEIPNRAELYETTSHAVEPGNLEDNLKQSDCAIFVPENLDEPIINTTPVQSMDKSWLNLQYHDEDHPRIKKPNEIEKKMNVPPSPIDDTILNRIQGSMIGMALGDALGAHVEFRPRHYLVANPVKDLGSGGTWGLDKGQFTDDTSMALCLANSLVSCRDFVPYDQLVRYKWWYKTGYMSSTGKCFDIGAATSQSVAEFEHRQREFAKKNNIELEDMDSLSDHGVLKEFDVYCSEDGVAGNGALMRLAPVPLFFYRNPAVAVEYSGCSGQITHGDKKAYDACRYYGALIVAALRGYPKDQLLDKEFYLKHKEWFGENELHPDIKSIAEGSYQKNGYDEGIRGKGYIVSALEAALWAFWSDKNSFETGALAAVNLGDDTDTTAAIYGQLAGAYYGYQNLPKHWSKHVYARTFLEKLSKWIAYEGECWQQSHESSVSQS